jgi:hypothetical protein
MHDEHETGRRGEREERAGREGGILDLLRRVVGQRQPTVLVMEPDGRMVGDVGGAWDAAARGKGEV